MHSLSQRREQVNLLYVKSILRVWDIGNIFSVARTHAPCLLILEDIDTLVSSGFQSYFFNEVDGLASNDGIMMIATTNHLEKLDSGLANRPSRFDRKYNFPLPSFDERVLYSEFWRKKLQDKEPVDFPKVLSPEIARITEDFSFAYMKEAFIATLLGLARAGPKNGGKDDKGIDDLPFWKEMQKEVKILRDEMRTKQEAVEIALPPQFNTATAVSHLHQSEVRPEMTLPHRPGGNIPGCESTTSSMPLPNNSLASDHWFAEPALPTINPCPLMTPTTNQFPWATTSRREGGHGLATFGSSHRKQDQKPILGMDEGSPPPFMMGRGTI